MGLQRVEHSLTTAEQQKQTLSQITKQQYTQIVGYKVIMTNRHLEKMNTVASVEGKMEEVTGGCSSP